MLSSRSQTAPKAAELRVYIDYFPTLSEGNAQVIGFGLLEWTFLAILVLLVGAAGVFALFLLFQLFQTHSRRG